MAEERKQQLTRRRSTLIASLRRADQFVQQFDVTRDQQQVKIRIEVLDTVWMGLDEVQTELEMMETSDEGMTQNNETRTSFESQYFNVKAALQARLPPAPSTASAIPNVATTGLSGIKLPTISLPEFNGDYNQWLAFHDTFDTLIHSNADVPAIQKFHYLRAALKGEAAQLIESIAISSANYTVAWQALTSRYANDYLLKKRHLQALLDCPSIKRESAQSLHRLVDEFERHTKILRQLKEPVDQWSTILEHMLCTRLDDATLQAWEDHASTTDTPNYKCLVDFLQRRIRVLESMSVNHHQSASQSSSPYRKPFYNVATHAAAETPERKCYACDDFHPLIHCPYFGNMSPNDRMKVVTTHRLCHNCFRQYHFARQCQSQYSCRECQERHHTLLHYAFPSSEASHTAYEQRVSTNNQNYRRESSTTEPPTATLTSATKAESINSVPTSNSNVLLSTVVLLAVDIHGNTHPVRALLDNGSQSNIISERLCRMLDLKRTRVNIPLHGVGQSSTRVQHTVSTRIRSRRNVFEAELNFLVMPSVTINLPTVVVSVEDWHTPKDVFLADPTFNHPGPIDMLLGAEHFFSFLKTGMKIEEDNRPTLIDSVFGWVISGRSSPCPPSHSTTCHVSITGINQHNVGNTYSMARGEKTKETSSDLWQTQQVIIPRRSSVRSSELRSRTVAAVQTEPSKHPFKHRNVTPIERNFHSSRSTFVKQSRAHSYLRVNHPFMNCEEIQHGSDRSTILHTPYHSVLHPSFHPTTHSSAPDGLQKRFHGGGRTAFLPVY